MTDLPTANRFEDPTLTNLQAKQAQDAMLAAMRESPGGDAEASLTITAGVIVPTRAFTAVDTEASSVTDDLTNVRYDNMPDGRAVFLRCVDATRRVVVRHGAGGNGQVLLSGGRDVTLDDPLGYLFLVRRGTTWVEWGRSLNLLRILTLTGALNESYATVASHATAADIWGALGNVVNFTGTATVTAFPAAPQAGARRRLICAGACAFTTGANFVVDGGNFTAAAGDVVDVEAVSTTSFKLHPLPVSGVVSGQRGGTGVANTGKTLTYGGNVLFSGAYSFAATLTGATTVTFPTTGTLATLAGPEQLTNKSFGAMAFPGGGTMDGTGRLTLPAQPAFSARRTSAVANVTGDGTNYDVVFDTLVFDQAGEFNTSTGVHTAAQSGRYWYTVAVYLTGLTSAHTEGDVALVTSNRWYYGNQMNYASTRDVGGALCISFSVLADMDAGDTAKVVLHVSNGTKAVSVFGHPSLVMTHFQGVKTC